MATGCTCGYVTEGAFGKACPSGQRHMRYYYTGIAADGKTKTSYYDVCVGRCNPLSCTNNVCNNNVGCPNARAQFCKDHGVACPGGKKCYGPNGQHPCPAACNKTLTDASNAIIDYLLKNCPYGQYGNCSRTTVLNPDCNAVINWMRGHLTSGYSSGLKGVIQLMCNGGTISGRNLASHIAFVANTFRCSYIQDKAFGTCRGGCPGGTCGGKKCTAPGTHLNTNNCNCDKDNVKDPLTDFFGSWCHTFDFLPWGGCNNMTNTMLFVGGILLAVFVLMRRV